MGSGAEMAARPRWTQDRTRSRTIPHHTDAVRGRCLGLPRTVSALSYRSRQGRGLPMPMPMRARTVPQLSSSSKRRALNSRPLRRW